MALARVFLGVAPDPALRSRLTAIGEGLRGAVPGARWIEPADLHITLVFLGATAPQCIAALHECVVTLAPQLARFAYVLHGPRLFPDARRPRVLALLPEDPAGFQRWQAPLAQACTELGCRLESRAYRPHLSLARFKRAPAGSVDGAQDLPGEAHEVVLFESRHGHYQPLFAVACASPEQAA